MNRQFYVMTTSAFDEALDAFQKAVEGGDDYAIRQARQAVEKLAATQAAEYDQQVREGILHHYRNWVQGQSDNTAFSQNLLQAIYAGVPSTTMPGASFSSAFPHLDRSGTQHAGLRYASIFTERIWLVHEAIKATKTAERI